MSGAGIVTIDGPSGSGKGTISRAVARQVHWHLLDSGALYRLVAFAGAGAGLAADDIVGHARLAAAMDVRFGADREGRERVLLDGQEVGRRCSRGSGPSPAPPDWSRTAATWAPSYSPRHA